MDEPIQKRQKRRSKLKSIPYKIRTISIITFLVILFFFDIISSLLMGVDNYNKTVRQVRTELNGIADSMEQTYSRYIDKSQIFNDNPNVEKLLTTQNSNAISDYQTFLTSLATNDQNILDIILVNTEGVVCYSITPDMNEKNISQNDSIAKILNGDKYVIGNLEHYAHLEQDGFIIAVPIQFQNKMIGVAALILSTDAFKNTVEHINILNVQYYITDCNETIIFSNKEEEVGTSYPAQQMKPFVMPIIQDETETKEITLDNIRYMIKETTLPSSGWVIRNLTDHNVLSESFFRQTRILIIFVIVSCILATLLTSIIFKPFTKSINGIIDTTKAIANGELSSRVPESKYSIEFHNLVTHINLMAEKLSTMIHTTSTTITQVEESSENLCAVSEQVQSSAIELNQKVSFIADKATEQNNLSMNSTQEVTTLGSQIEELYEKNKEMIQYSENMKTELDENTSLINELTKETDLANDSSKEVSHQVTNLAEQFKKVSEIVGIIKNISRQTDLLSLNASIEAARAGDAGRGFSVVANEIRSLSEEVQNSVNSISQIIHNVESIASETQLAANESDRIVSVQKESYREMQQKFSVMAQAILDMKKLSDSINEYVVAISNKKDNVLQLMHSMEDGSVEIENITRQASIDVKNQTKAFEEVSISAENLIQHAQQAKDVMSYYSDSKQSN